MKTLDNERDEPRVKPADQVEEDQEASTVAFTHTHFDLVVVAASAGGLMAIREVLSGLDDSFPAAVAIVQHLDPHRESQLTHILNRSTTLQVIQVNQMERLVPGRVYIAPPNHHVLIDQRGHLTLSMTPPIHFLRPAADPLFESAARYFGKRVIAVVLSGTGRDGSEGIKEIKAAGGMVIAQDIQSSQYTGMPEAAIETGSVDLVLPLKDISANLNSLVKNGCKL